LGVSAGESARLVGVTALNNTREPYHG